MSLYNKLPENEYIPITMISKIKKDYLCTYNDYKKIRYFLSKRNFRKEYKNIDKEVNIRNDRFIKKELEDSNEILSNINNKSLDLQQRKAIIFDEDSLLVVAGAGSGKTLTIIGKIKYLIERKGISPKKILCISFTNTITADLKNSIKKSTSYDIDVVTFHKLGMNILRSNKINPDIIEEGKLLEIIKLYFTQKIFRNEEIFKKFYSYYPLKKNYQKFKTENDVQKIENYKEIIQLIITFLNLFKARGYTKEKWIEIEEQVSNEKNRLLKKKNNFLIKIVKEIYMIYTTYLEKENKIDFHDMIKEATNLLQEGGTFKKYDYIIVDEYQDTSFIRYELLNTLKEIGNSKLMAVGDDWQSIYKFTGCDIDMFTNFKKYFPYSKILKIETTYRNPQELIQIVGNFIMKNKRQIQKNLKSAKTITQPIKIYYYNQKEEFSNLLDSILKDNQTYYILGRNNRDINFLKSNENYLFEHHQITYLKKKKAKLFFYTVHTSKGLECDNVILINMEDSNTGFPNQILDDPILKYVNNRDLYPYEEERRLFYTALTRTKNIAYLFCPLKNPSSFIIEILNDYKNQIEIIHK